MKSYTAAFLLQTDEEQYLRLLFLIFLVKAIAGNTNNSSTEEGITKQYRDEEPRCIHFSTAIKYIRM